MKTGIAVKNVTFKLQDVQQLAEQNFAAVIMEEWAAVCSRHAKTVEEEYMNREHEMDSLTASWKESQSTLMTMMMIMMTCQNLQLVMKIMMIHKKLVQSSVTASEVK